MLYTKTGKFPLRKLKTSHEQLFFNHTNFGISKPITFVDLYKLFIEKNPLAYTYASLHNIEFFGNLMHEIRESIDTNNYENLKNSYLKYYL